MFGAWVLFPLLLLALCCGLGLLLDAVCGRRLPGALVPPAGFAAIVIVGTLTTLTAATAPLTVPALVLLAGLGLIVSLPWRFGRPDAWAIAAALGVFAVYAAPVVLSGEPTFAGYIKLDDTATWLAITDRLMEHGRSLSGLPPSSYEATLSFNLAGWYPVGAFIPFGAGAKLSGQELAWVFQPYLSLLAAFTALSLYQLTERIRARPAIRAAIVFIAAQAALLFAYAMWGGIKELVTAALVGLIAALAPRAIEDDSPTVRSLAPLATGCAALIAVLSFGAGPWLLGLLGVAALLLLASRGAGALLATGSRFLVWLLPLAAIGFFGHPIFPSSTGGLLSGSSDLGNLTGPISPSHAMGIWPAHDFRAGLHLPAVGAALICLAAGAALYGAWRAFKDRDPALLVALGGAGLGCLLIALFGSTWVGAKAYATVSPFALLFAFAGAIALTRIKEAHLIALIVAAAVGAGVLWSNALGYGGVSLGPHDQLSELESIGKRFAGNEPALMTDYSPYGARHFLRDMAAEGASELRRRPVLLSDGTELPKGATADLDRFALDTLLTYKALVVRRSPAESRPPAPFELAWRGRYYDVWLQGDGAPRPIEHLPLGSVVDPVAVPKCADVLRLAREAGPAGSLIAPMTEPPTVLALGSASLTGGVQASPAGSTYLDPNGAGSFAIDASLTHRGLYEVWLGGSIRPSATLYVDGQRVGGVRQELNTIGPYIYLGATRLAPGAHTFSVKIGGPDLHPGSAGSAGPIGPLLIGRPNDDPRLVTVPASDARSLCGKQWDWIEAVAG